MNDRQKINDRGSKLLQDKRSKTHNDQIIIQHRIHTLLESLMLWKLVLSQDVPSTAEYQKSTRTSTSLLRVYKLT